MCICMSITALILYSMQFHNATMDGNIFSIYPTIPTNGFATNCIMNVWAFVYMFRTIVDYLTVRNSVRFGN